MAPQSEYSRKIGLEQEIFFLSGGAAVFSSDAT
jgi:hypothetical protein